MPIVEVKMWEGRSEEEKAEIIERITEALSDVLGVSAEHIEVVIYDIPKQNWGIRGKPSSKLT